MVEQRLRIMRRERIVGAGLAYRQQMYEMRSASAQWRRISVTWNKGSGQSCAFLNGDAAGRERRSTSS